MWFRAITHVCSVLLNINSYMCTSFSPGTQHWQQSADKDVKMNWEGTQMFCFGNEKRLELYSLNHWPKLGIATKYSVSHVEVFPFLFKWFPIQSIGETGCFQQSPTQVPSKWWSFLSSSSSLQFNILSTFPCHSDHRPICSFPRNQHRFYLRFHVLDCESYFSSICYSVHKHKPMKLSCSIS